MSGRLSITGAFLAGGELPVCSEGSGPLKSDAEREEAMMAHRVWQEDDVDTHVGGVHVLMRIGRREEQQDAVYVGPGVVAVADGMGGHTDGAAASKVALDAFAATIDEGGGLSDAAAHADAAVHALASGGWSPRAPGTTLVAARLDGEVVRGVWSGDSRAYRLRNDGLLELLMEDHSGFLGAIEHALGAFDPDALHLDGFSCDLADTAGLLLCTDGLTGPFDAACDHGGTVGDVELVDDDATATIEMLLTDRGIRGLVELAAQAGSDNIAALWWPL
jgi:serine/threonine protein phosphatase PrpC